MADLNAAETMNEPRAASRLPWFLLVLVTAAGFLYVSLFSLSGIPHFRSGDQSFFWTYACRLLSGQIFLRDFHQFTPPGADLVYAAAFHSFGVSVRSIDWLIFALGLSLAAAAYFCALSILPPARAALAALLVAVFIYGDRLDATHHWFSSLANLLAVRCLATRRTPPRIAAVGVCLALAAFFTQTRGVAGLLACSAALLFEWKMRRTPARVLLSRLAVLWGVAAAAWIALIWHFLLAAGFARYWSAQVSYLPHDADFPTGFLVPQFLWSPHLAIILILVERLAIYLVVLLVPIWIAAHCLRRSAQASEDRTPLFLLASLGTLQMLEVVTALNWNRMAAVAIPATILAVFLIGQSENSRRPRIIAAAWTVLALLMIAKAIPLQRHRYPRIVLSTGVAFFQPEDAEEVRWLVDNTRPGDAFFEAANTRFYAPLELRNPTPVDLLTTGSYTLPAWVAEVIASLDQSRTRYILWSQHSGIGSVEQLHTTAKDHLDPMRLYMQSAYLRIRVFANGDEIWQRRNP
jgi:hypothetical protein